MQGLGRTAATAGQSSTVQQGSHRIETMQGSCRLRVATAAAGSCSRYPRFHVAFVLAVRQTAVQSLAAPVVPVDFEAAAAGFAVALAAHPSLLGRLDCLVMFQAQKKPYTVRGNMHGLRILFFQTSMHSQPHYWVLAMIELFPAEGVH